MNLRILKCVSPQDHRIYRGTDRMSPYYVDGLYEDHPVNQAFFWYCEEGEELGVVHDLTRARKLVQLYRALDVPQCFEIVQVVDWIDGVRGSGELRGYDLSAGYNYSLLEWHLEIDRDQNSGVDHDERLEVLQPLLRLVKEHFQPLLNANGLFADGDSAAFCLVCMMALQRMRPNLWENDEVVFDVVGLWVLPS
jgi:hypothetical protein